MIPRLLCVLLVVTACTTKEEIQETISEITPPCQGSTSLPYLITGDDGNLYFSWVEKKDSGWVELKYSKVDGNEWMEPELITKGDDWFVNWADYPMIAIKENGDMIAHYLRKSSAGTYSYNINVVTKSKNGKWSNPIIPHDDGTPTEHGFVTILPESEGFRMAWLDGRNTSGGHHGSHTGAMTIRTALMKIDGSLSEEAELDNRVCDCCQTTGALTSNGPIFLFRDRSEMEIRDVSIIRKEESGWTSSLRIFNDNWKIEGCPVNGPRADAIGNNVVVAWYTAPYNQPKIKVAFSKDAGTTFEIPIEVDAISPIGRVDVVMISPAKALVSWVTIEKETTYIKGRFIYKGGKMDDPINIAKTSKSRGSGFPQVAKHNGHLYFAWTDIQDEKETIRMKRLKI